MSSEYNNKPRLSHLDTFNRLRGVPARNQTQQSALHRVKLSGVDEWVGTDVEISDKQNSVVVLRSCSWSSKNGFGYTIARSMFNGSRLFF